LTERSKTETRGEKGHWAIWGRCTLSQPNQKTKKILWGSVSACQSTTSLSAGVVSNRGKKKKKKKNPKNNKKKKQQKRGFHKPGVKSWQGLREVEVMPLRNS